MNVDKMVPPTGFLPRYLSYARELTDAPEVFHIASMLAVHSAVVANYTEVFYPTVIAAANKVNDATDTGLPAAVAIGNEDVRYAWSPIHLWVLLVADSGDRKGTALKIAKEVAGPVIDEQIAGMGTPESTFDLVSHKPDAFFYYPEGATFFSMLQASYWLHGAGTFPELYDGEPMQRCITGQRTKKNPNPEPLDIKIPRPRVTLATGIAPEHLDNARSSDWAGGLVGRMIMIHGKRERHDPVIGKKNETEMLRLREQLERERMMLLSNNTVKRIGLKAKAARYYLDWSKKVDDTREQKPTKTRSLFNRVPQHILRVAAHYALFQNSNVIDLTSMEAAVNFGNYIIESIDRVGNMLTDDKVLRQLNRIRDYLRQFPGKNIPMGMISTGTGMSKATMRLAIESLMANGELVVSHDNRGQLFMRLTAPNDTSTAG